MGKLLFRMWILVRSLARTVFLMPLSTGYYYLSTRKELAYTFASPFFNIFLKTNLSLKPYFQEFQVKNKSNSSSSQLLISHSHSYPQSHRFVHIHSVYSIDNKQVINETVLPWKEILTQIILFTMYVLVQIAAFKLK